MLVNQSECTNQTQCPSAQQSDRNRVVKSELNVQLTKCLFDRYFLQYAHCPLQFVFSSSVGNSVLSPDKAANGEQTNSSKTVETNRIESVACY